MSIHNKDNGKKAAVTGLIIGLVVAGLKGREIVESHEHHGGPLGLTKKDWKQVIFGTKDAFGDKNLSILAAGVAYFSTLAVFPLLAAAVAISALLISPEQLNDIAASAQMYLPPDVSSIVTTQLENLVGQRANNFLAAAIAIAIALFGASGASKNLVIASNVAYGVKETRGWLSQQFWGILWTLAGIGSGFIFVALLALNRSFLSYIGVVDAFIPWLLYGRWFAMIFLVIFGLAFFYRYGPDRPKVRWQWVSWGAVIATLAWLLATFLFFVYVQSFANYSQSYSLFAGIIVLMIWINLSALIVLVGAEINHQIELITRRKAHLL